MKIPKGMTEDEVVKTIEEVVNILASKFTFGYNSKEDMKQEGARFAIKAINDGDYDETRPLKNFLYRHVRNRLINYKRDNYFRNESPCKSCVFFDPKYKKSTNQCGAFPDKGDCKKLSDWQRKSSTKQSLMRPVDVSLVNEDSMSMEPHDGKISFEEIKKVIEDNIPVDLRSDYLRMIDGVQIPKSRRQKIRNLVLEIWRKYE